MQSDFAPCVVPWSGMGHSGLEIEWRVARDGRGGTTGAGVLANLNSVQTKPTSAEQKKH